MEKSVGGYGSMRVIKMCASSHSDWGLAGEGPLWGLRLRIAAGVKD